VVELRTNPPSITSIDTRNWLVCQDTYTRPARKACPGALAPESLAHQQMPGFFVLGVFGVWAVGDEEDVGLVVGGGGM